MTAEEYLTVKDVKMLVISDGGSEEYRNFNLVPLLDAGAGGVIFYVDTESEDRLSGLNVQHKIQEFLRKTKLQESWAYICWPEQKKNIRLTRNNFFNSLLISSNFMLDKGELVEIKSEEPATNTLKDKLPSLFMGLRDVVNRAEMISRSGNVEETCILLSELIEMSAEFQKLLLLPKSVKDKRADLLDQIKLTVSLGDLVWKIASEEGSRHLYNNFTPDFDIQNGVVKFIIRLDKTSLTKLNSVQWVEKALEFIASEPAAKQVDFMKESTVIVSWKHAPGVLVMSPNNIFGCGIVHPPRNK